MADTMTKANSTKQEGEPIDLTAKTPVTMTAKAPHHKEGEVVSVHPKIAELFIKQGFAKGSK
jgi:hypothetical protein